MSSYEAWELISGDKSYLNISEEQGENRSSLNITETSIIGAALETIQKIGPCDSKVNVTGIEDVRVSKRDFVLSRAKDLLKGITSEGPDSAEMTDAVSKSVK